MVTFTFVNLFNNHVETIFIKIDFISYCVCVLFSFSLKVTSFNIYGIKSSVGTLQRLAEDYDIILLQEHWLYPDELPYVSNICNDFCSFSLSPMSIEDKLIQGRPHGGVSIMWKKSFSQHTKIIQYDDNRIIGLEFKTNTYDLLFVCVYLPYECDFHYDDCFFLHRIESIIETANTPYTFV